MLHNGSNATHSQNNYKIFRRYKTKNITIACATKVCFNKCVVFVIKDNLNTTTQRTDNKIDDKQCFIKKTSPPKGRDGIGQHRELSITAITCCIIQPHPLNLTLIWNQQIPNHHFHFLPRFLFVLQT